MDLHGIGRDFQDIERNLKDVGNSTKLRGMRKEEP